jgi:O-antigen ligase
MSITRRSTLMFVAAGCAGVAVLIPLLARPVWVLAMVPIAVAAAVASRSVAVPLGLAGAAPIVDAIVGANPLPKGGFTLLFALWISLALVLALLRATKVTPTTIVLSVSTLASFALLGLFVLRLEGSHDGSYGSTKTGLYIADVLVAYMAAIAVGRSRRELRRFFVAVFAVSTAGASIFVVALFAGSAQAIVGGRYSLAAEQYPIELGRQSAIGLLIATAAILGAKGRVRLLAAALTVPLVVTLLAAGSRGPVLALAAGLVVLMSLAGRTTVRGGVLLLVGALVASAIVAPLLVPHSALGRAVSILVGSENGVSSNGRSAIWSVALSTIEAHPLFGIGTGGFAALGTGVLYPHNIVLEVAVETGVLGAAALLALLGGFLISLRDAWRRAGDSDRLTVALVAALFASALVNAFLSGAIQDNAAIWIAGGLAVGLRGTLPFTPGDRER